VFNGTEDAQCHPTTELQNAEHLTHCSRAVREKKLEPELTQAQIEGCIREWHCERTSLIPFDRRRIQRSGDGKHPSINIEANYTPGTHAFSGKAGDDASTTCDIEHTLSGTGSRAVDQIGGPE
jgi:hypothetical protein